MSTNANAARILFDEPGPRGRRKILIGSIAATAVLVVVISLGLYQLGAHGQLDYDKWRPFAGISIVRFLLKGAGRTLFATVVSAALSFPLGVLLGLARLSSRRWVRLPAGAWIDVMRAIPLLLLIYFFLLALPAWGLSLPIFWKLVIPIVMCSSATTSEVFRAGVLALDRGQGEAAAALGLTPGQAMRLIIAPQALRLMLPNLVTQLITILKDSTLGFVVSYEELMRQGKVLTQTTHLYLQTYVIIAAVYFLLNWLLSILATRLDAHVHRKLPQASTHTEPTTTVLA